jgi:hypothetical protein
VNRLGPLKKQFCVRGHDTAICGRYKNSTCRACAVNHKPRTDQIRNWHYKNTFGITLEEYNTMFIEQKGLCLGCYKHQSDCQRALHVDHDHKTGKIRGLLCHECNSALGYIKDSPTTLRRLADYIEARGAL